MIEINEMLANILVNNLIKNAYTHNIENGRICIEISSAKLLFSNTGQEKSLDPKLVFERFYQGSKKEGSTGLGLALVKSICDLEQLHIRYFLENNLHNFEVSQ